MHTESAARLRMQLVICRPAKVGEGGSKISCRTFVVSPCVAKTRCVTELVHCSDHVLVSRRICWIAAALLWVGVRQACSPAVATFHRNCHHISHVCRRIVGGSPSFGCAASHDCPKAFEIPAPAHSCVPAQKQQSSSQSLTTCPCNKGGCRLPFASGMRWLPCRWTTFSVTYCMIVCRMQDRQGRAMLVL